MKRNENVGVLTPKSYQHDLSHQHCTTLDWFRIQPISCIELVEGDKFSIDLSTILEAAPLATKVYGSAYLDIHAFFVPSRILWSDWLNYRYGNDRGTSNFFSPPSLTMGQLNDIVGGGTLKVENGQYVFTEPSQSHHSKELRRTLGGLGYPVSSIVNIGSTDPSVDFDNTFNDLPISLLPARAFNRVWWDWYRDSVHIEESSKSSYLYTKGGPLSPQELFSLNARYRCFRKDYITTLLSSPQLGAAANAKLTPDMTIEESYVSDTAFPLLIGENGFYSVNAPIAGSEHHRLNSLGNISVSALRGAVAMQRYLEKLNVTGTRPIERIQALFGGSPSPVRLDMSELIGTHRQRVNVQGLTNTGSNVNLGTSESPNAFGIDDYYMNFGQQTGRSYTEGGTPKFNYSATEDGFIVICASLMPEYINPTATNRMFFRGLSTPDSNKLDYYTPEFDGIGYQECLMSEVCLPEYTAETQGKWGIDYDPYKVVGYQPKYEDYRYIQDRMSGDFNESQTFEYMRNLVYVRNFIDGNQSGAFPVGVQLTTPTENDRANFDNHFQVTDASLDHFIFNVYLNIKASRPISKVELPTALSDMANSEFTDVSNGGIRL